MLFEQNARLYFNCNDLYLKAKARGIANRYKSNNSMVYVWINFNVLFINLKFKEIGLFYDSCILIFINLRLCTALFNCL